MVIIWFVDLGPIIIGALILLFALVDKLMVVLPVIQWIFWILFALLSAGALYMVISDGYDSLAQRLLHACVLAGCLLFLGVASHEFFASVIAAYGDGGFGGIFEMILTVIFGAFGWLLEFMGATFVAIMLPSTKYGELSTGKLILSLFCTIGLVVFALG